MGIYLIDFFVVFVGSVEGGVLILWKVMFC